MQALIIENAIPELAEETNRILDRLTDGDMSLYFDTLRESKTKKDGPIETLDIKVSDNLGTRPLEDVLGWRRLPGRLRPADRPVQAARPPGRGALANA